MVLFRKVMCSLLLSFSFVLYSFSHDLKKASFKSILMNADLSELNTEKDLETWTSPAKLIVEDLGLSCAKQLKIFYNNEGKFFFKSIASKIVPLKDYFNSYVNGTLSNDTLLQGQHPMSKVKYNKQRRYMGLRNNVFYHYFYWPDRLNPLDKEKKKQSEYVKLKNFIKKHSMSFSKTESNPKKISDFFAETMKTMRTENLRFGKGIDYAFGYNLSGVLYFAAGPYSSSSYGNTLMSISLSPLANIFPTYGSSSYSNKTEWTYDVVKEINNTKYLKPVVDDRGIVNYEDTVFHKNYKPLMDSCINTEEWRYNDWDRVVAKIAVFIFEDHNIDLIHYTAHYDWFQLLSHQKIENVRLTKMIKRRHSGISMTDFSDRTKDWIINQLLKLQGRYSEIHGFYASEDDFELDEEKNEEQKERLKHKSTIKNEEKIVYWKHKQNFEKIIWGDQ